jgi:hypothetical protein
MCHGSGRLEIPQSLLDGPLGPIILRAVALDHRERYADGNAFREELARIDPATISPVITGELTRQLNEISSSMRTVSGLNAAVTGSGVPPNTNRGRDEQTDPGVIVGFGENAPSIDEGDTNPEPLTIAELNLPANTQNQRRPWLTAGGVVVLFFAAATVLGAVVGVYLMGSSSGTRASPEGAPIVATLPERPLPSLDPSVKLVDPELLIAVGETPDSGKNLLAPTAPEAVTATRTVEVVSRPTGAKVYRGDKQLGKTPLQVEFADKDALPMKLHLRSTGYQAKWVTILPTEGPTKTVRLTKTPASDNKVRKPKAKPRFKVTIAD